MKKTLAAFAALSFLSVAHAATIVHTNDVSGEIEPCGCRSNPLGGMPRKANLLKKLADKEILQLDAGDLLFPSPALPEMLHDQAELQAEFLLKSMDLVHHDAAVPGEKDFALGLKVFENLRKKTQIQFIAANLHKKKGAFLKPNAIFTRKDANGHPLKIAVFGLVGDDLTWPKELKVSSPIAEAKKQVAELRPKADILVALTHEGYEKDLELAKKVKGIDIIIGGHSQSFLQTPVKEGQTTIYQSSFRNQYVGVLPVTKPFTGEGYELVGLDAGLDSPTEAPSKEDELVKDFKTAVATLNSKQEEAMLKTNTMASSESASMGSKKFHTFPRCAECHLKQFDFWRKTNHAVALEPLIKKQEVLNKECLSCHTVGLGDPEGLKNVTQLAEFRDGKPIATDELAKLLRTLRDGPLTGPLTRSLNAIGHSWTPVQCENCHQPGRDHPFSGTYSKVVEKNACLSCHTKERASDWYDSKGQLDKSLCR